MGRKKISIKKISSTRSRQVGIVQIRSPFIKEEEGFLKKQWSSVCSVRLEFSLHLSSLTVVT